MDIRMWSKEVITDFIILYKSYPCLWKVKSDNYKNRNLRETAYIKIIDFRKERGFPEANRDFVVKKIQSLRGSFRKELKKLQKSQRSGRGTDEIYTPSLWYYDLLLFTKDQELPTASISNIVDSESQDTENEEIIEDTETELEEPNSLRGLLELPKQIETTPKPASNTRKRKLANSQAKFLEMCATTLKSNSQPLNEFDAVGLNVSKKLAKMEPLQAVYAESLINGIIRRDMLKQLSEETDLCDNRCTLGRVVTPSSLTSLSSASSTSQLLLPVRREDTTAELPSFLAEYSNNTNMY